MPSPLAHKSLIWRLSHSINYLIGGVSFLIGSVLVLPIFETKFNNVKVYSLLYIFGSIFFVIADFMNQFCFQTNKKSHDLPLTSFIALSVIYFGSFCGSTLYLFGSILLIPDLELTNYALKAFIIGSILIMFVKLWYIILLSNKETSLGIYDNVQKQATIFVLNVTITIGSFMYLIGSILFIAKNKYFLEGAKWIFLWGGIFYYFSSIIMLKRDLDPSQLVAQEHGQQQENNY